MNTGKYYNKIVYGSGIQKINSQFEVLKQWLSHPELKKSHQLAKRSKLTQYIDFLSSIILHGATLEDYLLYEFYNKSNKERKTYVTGKKLHDFFDKVNNKDKTDIFIDKNKFAQFFSDYLGRKTFALDLDDKNIARLTIKDEHTLDVSLSNDADIYIQDGAGYFKETK